MVKKVNSFKADDSVFGIEPKYLRCKAGGLSEMANMRQGTHSSKNRAKVNGGGKKPWKQKGLVLPVQGLFALLSGEEAELFSGLSHTNTRKKVSKKLSRLARISVLSSKAAGRQSTGN